MKQRPPRDPFESLKSMTAAQIESRLAELHEEDTALRTLLRAIRARERAKQKRTRLPAQEAAR